MDVYHLLIEAKGVVLWCKAATRVLNALCDCFDRCTVEEQIEIACYQRNIHAVLLQLNRATLEAELVMKGERASWLMNMSSRNYKYSSITADEHV